MPRAPARNDRTYESAIDRCLDEAARTIGPIDIINAHVVLPSGLAAVRAGGRLGLPVVLTEHSSPFSVHLATPAQRDQAAEALTSATRVVAVGPRLRDEIHAVVDVPVDVVGNLVADAFFAARIPARAAPPAPRLLAVGYLVRQKRFDVLLRAVRVALPLVPAIEVVIVGEGPELPSLRTLAAALGIEGHIRFVPMTDRPGLIEWLAWADALVSSSDHESFGLVVAEALAAGRPVVTTASGGPEWFVDRDLGSVVPPGDPEALGGAITGLPAFIDAFDPRAARARMSARFGSAAFVGRMQRIFEQALASSGARRP